MKRFKDLTKPQQNEAVTYATEELKELIEMGIVHFPRPTTDALLADYAEAAAEDAFYAEAGDKVIYDIVE